MTISWPFIAGTCAIVLYCLLLIRNKRAFLTKYPTINRILLELFWPNLVVGAMIGLFLEEAPWSWWLGLLVYLAAFGGFKQKFLQAPHLSALIIVRTMYGAVVRKWLIAVLLLGLIWQWFPTVSAGLLLTSYGFNQIVMWWLPCFRSLRYE